MLFVNTVPTIIISSDVMWDCVCQCNHSVSLIQKLLLEKRHSLQSDHLNSGGGRGGGGGGGGGGRGGGERRLREELFYPSLTLLDVSHNELDLLPLHICDHVHLAELKISYNNIKQVYLRYRSI